ncbi:TonB-dependent receptor [Kordiimonas pumila]|uniref:TonB-dependent receptor n=1 Tax=Kordiimonas pumila TaxID=2161677 RepID=A0ABV7D6U6_9PROT|nr:TonB-dependent receptor [Kordiimonas pumila]
MTDLSLDVVKSVKNKLSMSVATGIMVMSLASAAQSQSTQEAEKSTYVGFEEIVVTARKREENLQDTPISISAFSGASLEARGISEVTGIANFTPNIVFQSVPSNSGVASSASIYIRGIGQNDFAPTVEPGVGMYIDGVYLGRSVGGVFDLIDIERIEVLRGPQGTLFGRNTIGGAVSITTEKPTREFGFKGDVKYGTDNLFNVRGVLNMPVSDNAGVKISGGYFSQDGYVSRPFDDQDLGNKESYTFKGVFNADITPDLEVTLAADYFRDKSNGPAVLITGVGDLEGFVALQNALAATGAPPPGFGGPGDASLCLTEAYLNTPGCYNSRYFGDDTNYGTGPNFSDIETWSLAGTLVWQLGAVELKSVTAYREINGSFAQDRDGSDLLINHVYDIFNQRQFSQELQLQGSAVDGRLHWLAGLYYFTEDGADINPIDFAPVSIQSGGNFDYESWAAFTQMTFDVTEKLSITGGLRYTKDQKDYTPDQYFEELPLGQIFTCFIPNEHLCDIGDRVVPNEVVSSDSSAWTPMVNVSYKWNEDLMTYATYSQGYKSGGFTQRVFPPEPSLPSFAPENVDSYEVGLKWTSPDRLFRLNLAGFFTDYSDLQLLVADGTRIGPFYTNAGKAEIKGFEAELTMVPGAGWQINATAGLTDAEYTQLDDSVQGLTLENEFVLVPKWNLSGGIEKHINLDNDSSLTSRVDITYKSGIYTNANGISSDRLYQPSYALINASVRWDISEQFNVIAGVENLTNKKFRTFGDYQPGFGFYMEGFDRGREVYIKTGVEF